MRWKGFVLAGTILMLAVGCGSGPGKETSPRNARTAQSAGQAGQAGKKTYHPAQRFGDLCSGYNCPGYVK